MQTIWIPAADNSRAHLYQLHVPDKTPQEIEKFDNPLSLGVAV